MRNAKNGDYSYSIKPNPSTYVLHSLQGQLSRIHDFIMFLNSLKLEHSFTLFGNISFHRIGPYIRRELFPL